MLQGGGLRAALFISRRAKDQFMPDDNLPTVAQSAIRGLACKCPRCGRGKLFAGFLTLRPRCEACGLDYTFIDTGDGPAIFIIMIAGAIVVASALIVEVTYQPPFWVHAVLWLPLILATTLLPLRSMKALLIALLEPTQTLRQMEAAGDYTGRLAMLEEMKTLPFGAVWDYHCLRQGVPVGLTWLDEARAYERDVLAPRGPR